MHQLNAVLFALEADVESLGATAAEPDRLLLYVCGQSPLLGIRHRENVEMPLAKAGKRVAAAWICTVTDVGVLRHGENRLRTIEARLPLQLLYPCGVLCRSSDYAPSDCMRNHS